jgi:hemerythrin
MALLQWQDRYSVGIEAVDHEHKELIDLINRLHDGIVRRDEPTLVEAFFGDLLRAISAHFALEERFMRDRHYDQFVPHKQEHERLLNEIRDLMDEFDGEREIDFAELASRLDVWFTRHFETYDLRLHKAFGAHS